MTSDRLEQQHRRFGIIKVLQQNHLQWLTYLATYLVGAFFAWRNISYLPGAILACCVSLQIALSIVYGYLESSVFHSRIGESGEHEEYKAIEKLMRYREHHFDLQRLGNGVIFGLTIWIIVLMFLQGPTL